MSTPDPAASPGDRGPETDISIAPGAPAEGAEPLPERIGPYKVEALLGRGGMGEVYRAWDPRLERRVAVKRILAERARPSARARFWREARVLASLKHPGLVALHDIGEDRGALYIAMELVEGAPLSSLRGARWPADAAVTLVLRLARALATAHDAGIVHRDIKASNVLLEPSGEPRLIDFGLARKGDDDDLTAQGAIVGTWSAMAPEQIAGEAVQAPTDVHALGLLLYTLLAGDSPYSRDSREATAAAIMTGAAPDLGAMRPDLPPALVALVKRCLRRRTNERPAHAGALAGALADVAGAAGWDTTRDVVRRGMAAAERLADPAPLAGSGLASAARPPAPRRRALAAGLALAALAGVLALVVAATSDAPTVASDPALDAAPPTAPARPTLEARAVGPRRASLAVDAMRTLPRKTLAVLPFVGDAAGPDLGLATAEALRRAFGRAPERLSLATWRELAARAPDGDPTRLSAAALDAPAGAAGAIDVVVQGRVERLPDGLRLTAELRLPSDPEPIVAVAVDVPANAPLVGVDALARALGDELGLRLAPPVDATRLDVVDGVAHLVRAELAQHAEHWRASGEHLEGALRADPSSPAVRLAAAALDLDLGAAREASVALAELAADPTLPARDRSWAALLGSRSEGGSARRHGLIDAHLARFPRDLDAHIERLQLDFLAVGAGSLERAAEHADRLLAMAPATPLVASKLVRAFGWIGRPEHARARLAAHGLTPASPGMAYVFGELALYEHDYTTAIAELAKAREPDGDPAFYAGNMLVAAYIVAGDYAAAERVARRVIFKSGRLGIDWTFFLLFNAHVGAGRMLDAQRTLAEWPRGERGTTPYVAYAGFVDAQVHGDRDALIAELLAREPAPCADSVLTQLILRWSHDPAIVAARIEQLDALSTAQLAARNTTADVAFRQVEGLVARLAFLEGDLVRANATLEGLARVTSWDIHREGDLFERARWLSVWAGFLDETGRREAGADVWRELLTLGYDRLLAMDVTFEATARLAH